MATQIEQRPSSQPEELMEQVAGIYDKAYAETRELVMGVSDDVRSKLAQTVPEVLYPTDYALARRVLTERITGRIIDSQISYSKDEGFDARMPFAVACEPYPMTAGEVVQVEEEGKLYRDFLQGIRDLYASSEKNPDYAWVRILMETGKSEDITSVWHAEQKQPIAPFFRPDITIGEDGTAKAVELVQMIGGWGMLTAVSSAYAKEIPQEMMKIVGETPVKHYLEMVKDQAERAFTLKTIHVLVDEQTDPNNTLLVTVGKLTQKQQAEKTVFQSDQDIDKATAVPTFTTITKDDLEITDDGYTDKRTGETIACLQLTAASQETALDQKAKTFVAKTGFVRSIPPSKGQDEPEKRLGGYIKNVRLKVARQWSEDPSNFPIAIVVSRELGAYKRELTHFAKACREGGGQVFCVYSDEVSVGDGTLKLADGTVIKGVHRFFQTYNLTEKEEQILQHADVVYPRSNSFLEEKSAMTLLYDQRLEKYWTTRLGQERFKKLRELFVETHVVNAQEPLTMDGTQHAWSDLLKMDKTTRLKELPVVIKVSGADGKIGDGKSDSWGARGVCTPLEDDTTYRTFVVRALKASSPDAALGIVLQIIRETSNRKLQEDVLRAYFNNWSAEKDGVIQRILIAQTEHVSMFNLGATVKRMKQEEGGITDQVAKDHMTKAIVALEAHMQQLTSVMRQTIGSSATFNQWVYETLVREGVENPESNRKRLYVAQRFIRSKLSWVWHLDPGQESKLAADRSTEPRQVRVARFHGRVNPFYITTGETVRLAGIGVTFSQTANQKSHLARSAIMVPAAVPPTNF